MAPTEQKAKGKSKQVAHKLEIDPQVATFITLDDISHKLADLITITKSNGNILKSVLTELQDEADEGEYMFVLGTATTVLSTNITDLLANLGHPVKGYIIKNDGANTIQVGHNITRSSIDSNIQTGSARFYPVFVTESHKKMFNRKVIRNVYIRTAAGTSAYRMWLLW